MYRIVLVTSFFFRLDLKFTIILVVCMCSWSWRAINVANNHMYWDISKAHTVLTWKPLLDIGIAVNNWFYLWNFHWLEVKHSIILSDLKDNGWRNIEKQIFKFTSRESHPSSFKLRTILASLMSPFESLNLVSCFLPEISCMTMSRKVWHVL